MTIVVESHPKTSFSTGKRHTLNPMSNSCHGLYLCNQKLTIGHTPYWDKAYALLAGLLVGQVKPHGSGRVGSGRIGRIRSGPVRSGPIGSDRELLKLSRIEAGHPYPTRLDLTREV